MSDDEWDAWAGKHAAVFALEGDANVPMFMAWREVFEARGYTAAELNEATVWIGGNAPPRYRSEHLDKIRLRIDSRRLAMHNAQAEEQNRAAQISCRRCRDAKILAVPHLRFVVDGHWVAPFRTFAVACNCRLGAELFNNLQGHVTSKGVPSPLMSIGDYEMQNPGWEEMVRIRDAGRAIEGKAAIVTRGIDKRLGEILKGIGRPA